MAGRNMRYILRDCNLFANRVDKIGQVSEITIPVPEVKVEELRNGGMVMPIEVHMGYEKPEMEFKMPLLDPQIIKLFGLAPGILTEYMATGAFVDETGEVHSGVCYMKAFLKKADPGGWKSGEPGEAGYSVSVREYDLEMDGEPLVSASPFDVSIGGISQTESIQRALLTTIA